MPKTFTDDVAAVLPSSIDGPLQVVDPADSTNSIKLDPAGGQIEARGLARPLRRIAFSFVRVYLSTTNGSTGVLTTQIVAAGTNGGVYVGHFRIPADMDVTQPSNVSFLLATGAAGPASAKKVRMLLVDTYIRGSGASVSTTSSYDWTAPVSWALGDNRIVQFDAGSGRTYDGNHFVDGDYVAMRISRNGTHPSDTYTQSVHFSESLVFEYTAKRF